MILIGLSYSNNIYRKEILLGEIALSYSSLILPNGNISIINPFNNIKEDEPYLEDNLWHIYGSAITYKINYQIFKTNFNYKYSEVYASIFTLLIWTNLEIADALIDVGFSRVDIYSDIIGILYEVVNTKREIPIKIRIGVKDWSELKNLLKDKNRYDTFMSNHYSIMKSDIVFIKNNYYIGLAVSKKENSLDNLFGISIGYNPFKNIGKYINLSIDMTLWNN